jgi:hypothetical protein
MGLVLYADTINLRDVQEIYSMHTSNAFYNAITADDSVQKAETLTQLARRSCNGIAIK